MTDGCTIIVSSAIDRSITHGEVVWIDYNPIAYKELLDACDDYVEANKDVVEFWGSLDTEICGHQEWRVHMRNIPADRIAAEIFGENYGED
jgi:hypothetical protein